MLEIRRMTVKDKNFYKDLGKLITSRIVYNELREPIITTEGQIWFVAYKKNKVIGFSSNYVKKSGLFIGYLYVIGSERNNGYGEKLLEEHIKYAKEINEKSISVMADKHYEKLFADKGFVTLSETVNYRKMSLEL